MAKVRKSLAELFEEHYARLWGERWVTLRAALKEPPLKVKVENPFADTEKSKELIFELDSASLVPPRELAPQAGESVLDLCAAPGGKSLMMMFQTHGEIQLTVNELSRPRFQRLKAVLHDYLPDKIMARVNFNCGDGATYCLGQHEQFDKVLVDAPCSGERHLLQSSEELKNWTPSRSKQLSVRQHSLLCAATDACKPGGRVVYSTCAISPLENDGVIAKLLKSRKGKFTVETSVSNEGEATEYGRIYLPDRDGAGPIYCAVLSKNSDKK